MRESTFINKIDNAFSTMGDGHIYKAVIEDAEKVLIEKALGRARGNQIEAARILGLNRNTIRSKIRKLRIDKERFKDE